jgi:predicted phage terminase large subunit-like protein
VPQAQTVSHKDSFYSFATHALEEQRHVPARHHKALITALERVAEGSTDRLMVQMPPGAAKSTYTSVLFPAWWFSRHPASQVIAACHTASLAAHLGRRVRNTILQYGEDLDIRLVAGSRAATEFGLASGGEYFAAGVRGPITGRRADLILIDDPIKSWAEADSRAARDALADWYRGELMARLKPKGRIVLIMTRWHEDDLAGRLLQEDDPWTVLRLPAIAEAGDPLGRHPGEALWPEWEDAETISRKRRAVGERAFAALYQQQPRSDEGNLFDMSRITIIDSAPATRRQVRAWDLAATAPAPGRDPDYTVGLKLGETEAGRMVVLDVIRRRARAAEVETLLTETAKLDGPQTLVALAQDPGQAGVAQIAYLTRSLAEFQVVATPETGAKLTRAMPAAAQIDSGNLDMLRSSWTDALLGELRSFPDGEKDDQVDALARAVTMLATRPAASRRINIPFLQR